METIIMISPKYGTLQFQKDGEWKTTICPVSGVERFLEKVFGLVVVDMTMTKKTSLEETWAVTLL
jgi:hypothetical protein